MAVMEFLGFMDFLAAVVLILLRFDMAQGFGIFFGIFLLIKGLIFIKSLAGILDILAGIIMLLAAYGHISFLTVLAVVWLLQKSLFSLF